MTTAIGGGGVSRGIVEAIKVLEDARSKDREHSYAYQAKGHAIRVLRDQLPDKGEGRTVVVRHAGDKKIQAIKEVRLRVGVPLKTAKEITEGTPLRMRSAAAAREMAAALESLGAVVAITDNGD